MIYIIKAVLDHNGNQVAREPLAATFDCPADASRFLDRYTAQVYADG